MRVANVNIPDNKKVRIALRYLYGVGPTIALRVLGAVHIDPDKRAKELTAEEVNKIQNIIKNLLNQLN